MTGGNPHRQLNVTNLIYGVKMNWRWQRGVENDLRCVLLFSCDLSTGPYFGPKDEAEALQEGWQYLTAGSSMANDGYHIISALILENEEALLHEIFAQTVQIFHPREFPFLYDSMVSDDNKSVAGLLTSSKHGQ